MSFDLFKKVIDESGDFVIALEFGMSGEPMLHPGLFNFIEYAQPMWTGITTNGTLIGTRLQEILSCQGLARIEVSMLDETPRKGIELFMEERVTYFPQLIVKTFKEHPIKIPSCDNSRQIKIRKRGEGKNIRTQINGKCHHLINNPAMSWDGKLLSCCADHDHISANGSLWDYSLKELWEKGFDNLPCKTCI